MQELEQSDLEEGDAEGRGRLMIQSSPPAQIWIDGKDVHQLTPARISLPAGPHRVTLVADRHRAEEVVQIQPDGDTRIVRRFAP